MSTPLKLVLLACMTMTASVRGAEANATRQGESDGVRLRGPKPSDVRLFVGSGDRSKFGRRLARDTGVTPYSPEAVLTLEQFTSTAIAALKREGREVAPDDRSAANIELSTGTFTISFDTKQESCFVSFDSSGHITRVGGARGFHGEGAWSREYRKGQPVGPANGSQPGRAETNRTSSAAGSRR
jgi:hypothetical protein